MYTIQYKEMAKEQMKGNMHTLIGGWLLYFILYAIIESPFIFFLDTIEFPFEEDTFSFILADYIIRSIGLLPVFFLTAFLVQGINSIHLDLSNDRNVEMGNLFSQLPFFIGSGFLFVIISVFFLLGSLLLIFPGIIVFYATSMAGFIYIENPYDSPVNAIIESIRIMNGHKMDLFKLHLNFFLWHLLGAVTCGIAYIYILPYILQAEANFYNDIK